MAAPTLNVNEVDVWTSVIMPDRPDMLPSDAEAVLRWSFNESANQRMEELAHRNGCGALTDAEREELAAYVHVGQVIGILQAKARLSLKRLDTNGNH